MKRLQKILVLTVLGSLPFLFVGLAGLTLDFLGEGISLLIFGFVVTTLSLFFVNANFARRSWPTTSGVVTHSELKTSPGLFGWRDPDGDEVHVSYAYEVEGKEFIGNLCITGGDHSTIRIVGECPKKGLEFTVYYNPQAPSKSVLVTGPGGLVLCFLVLGIAGIVGGCYLIR